MNDKRSQRGKVAVVTGSSSAVALQVQVFETSLLLSIPKKILGLL